MSEPDWPRADDSRFPRGSQVAKDHQSLLQAAGSPRPHWHRSI